VGQRAHHSSFARPTCEGKLWDLARVDQECHTGLGILLDLPQLLSPLRRPAVDLCLVGSSHVAGTCLAYTPAARSSSADGVAGLARHPKRTLATGVWAKSVDTIASGLVWER
jgi:hypothetical protein